MTAAARAALAADGRGWQLQISRWSLVIGHGRLAGGQKGAFDLSYQVEWTRFLSHAWTGIID